MTVDKETIDTHEYIVNKLNEYGLAYLHLTEPLLMLVRCRMQ
jgi:N-ethylmaleimide reductase